MSRIIINISGMHCSSCATLIEENIEALTGVIETDCSYAQSKCQIETDNHLDINELTQAVEKDGYHIVQKEEQ